MLPMCDRLNLGHDSELWIRFEGPFSKGLIVSCSFLDQVNKILGGLGAEVSMVVAVPPVTVRRFIGIRTISSE